MKSFIFAVILSIIITGTGVILSYGIENTTESLLQTNENLYTSLANKNEEKSISALDSAEKEFEKHKVLFESTADHEELLRIELQYASIREFINENQFGDALAACSEIDLLLCHLHETLKLKGENIL